MERYFFIFTLTEFLGCLLLCFFFLGLTFSRRNAILEIWGLLLSIICLVICETIWYYFMVTSSWVSPADRKEILGIPSILVITSIFLTGVSLVLVVITSALFYGKRNRYSTRQRIGFFISAVLLILLSAVFIRAPFAVEALFRSKEGGLG